MNTTTADLEKLRADVLVHLELWVKSGGTLTRYHCHKCKKAIVTKCPTYDQVGSKGYWDSLTTCVYCGGTNFVAEFPGGRTFSREFPPTNGRAADVEMTGRPFTRLPKTLWK